MTGRMRQRGAASGPTVASREVFFFLPVDFWKPTGSQHQSGRRVVLHGQVAVN